MFSEAVDTQFDHCVKASRRVIEAEDQPETDRGESYQDVEDNGWDVTFSHAAFSPQR